MPGSCDMKHNRARGNEMNRIIAAVGMATMFAGCAFNPEAMPVGDKDSAVYVDAGAPKALFAAEAKAKVAVITSVGEYKDYKQVGEMLDSTLTAKLSGFSFFQVVMPHSFLYSRHLT